MKIGQIGLGRWGKTILKNLIDISDIEEIWVYDCKKIDLPDELKSKVNVCSTLTEILENDYIKAVFISTPARTHFDLSVQCLNAHKDIFVEKPLTCNSDQISTLEKLLLKSSQVIMTDHTLLFDSHIQTIKKLIKSENIEPCYLDFIRSNITGNSDMNVIWDLAPHDIALTLYLVEDQVKSVYCRSDTTQDTAFIILQFNNDIIVKIQLSWRYPFRRRELILGYDQGSIYFSEHDRIFTLMKYDIHNTKTVINPDIKNMNNNNPLANSISFFLSKVGSHDLEFSMDQITFAKRVIKIIELMHISIETNQMVNL